MGSSAPRRRSLAHIARYLAAKTVAATPSVEVAPVLEHPPPPLDPGTASYLLALLGPSTSARCAGYPKRSPPKSGSTPRCAPRRTGCSAPSGRRHDRAVVHLAARWPCPSPVPGVRRRGVAGRRRAHAVARRRDRPVGARHGRALGARRADVPHARDGGEDPRRRGAPGLPAPRDRGARRRRARVGGDRCAGAALPRPRRPRRRRVPRPRPGRLPVRELLPRRPHRWGIRYAGAHGASGLDPHLVGARLFPTQPVETAAALVLVVAGSGAVLGSAPAGTALATYLVGYDVVRFGLEFVRGDARPHHAASRRRSG